MKTLNRCRMSALLLSCLLPLAIPRALAGPLRYEAAILGPLPGLVTSQASVINDAGVVVGHSFDPSYTPVPMLHVHGQTVPLLGLQPGARVKGINNAGIITGNANDQAFRYVNGVVTTLLPATPDPSARALAFGINDAGVVVGATTGDGKPWRTFIAEGTTMHELDIPGESLGYAINNRGDVIGTLRGPDSHRGFLYSHGTVVDIGDLGSNYTVAADINDAGAIVGQTGSEAFIYEHGSMRSLGTLAPGAESFALAINNRGQVVGWVEGEPQQLIPFLWEQGTMRDLRELVDPAFAWGSYTAVSDINEAGQIIGMTCPGPCVGFVLTPIPEPSRAAALVAGLALLGLWAGRRGRPAGSAVRG